MEVCRTYAGRPLSGRTERMSYEIEITQLDSVSAVKAVEATLQRIDSRLVDHGERVGYIACRLCDAGQLPLDKKTLFLLSVFHDVGAYKTDEIDRMVEFETKDVWNHAIYGYVFLKYLSPLGDSAEAVLYHHAPWRLIEQSGSPYGAYAALIHLADRFDIALSYGAAAAKVPQLGRNELGLFRPAYVDLLRDSRTVSSLTAALADGSYRAYNAALSRQFAPSPQEALEYLKLIVFSIDFRSDHTVTHSINVISLALYLARHFGLPPDMLEKIYLGALLHDVGKIAVPTEILESPGRLTDEQMRIMRTHVVETDALIRGVVPDEICEIAVRHHEKLDGSGYPHGLSGEVLTFPQRILAVADIVSALNSRRSYKAPFPAEKAVAILTEEMTRGRLDERICRFAISHYDEMIRDTEREREKVVACYQSVMNEFARMKSAVQ